MAGYKDSISKIDQITDACKANYSNFTDKHFMIHNVLYEKFTFMTLQNVPGVQPAVINDDIPIFHIQNSEKDEIEFWNPEEDILNHIRSMAENSLPNIINTDGIRIKVNLNKVKPWKRNPMLSFFPAKYGNQFDEFEINNCVRLSDINIEENYIKVQISNYIENVICHKFCDLKFKYKGSDVDFRNLSNDGKAFIPYRNSLLSNTIGIACLFLDSDNYPIFVDRDPDRVASIDHGGLHCTSSGVLEWDDLYFDGRNKSSMGISFAMQREIQAELGLFPTEYEISCVGLSRELVRAGKPQFFFLAKFPGTSQDFIDTHLERRDFAKESHEFKIKKGRFYTKHRPEKIRGMGRISEMNSDNIYAFRNKLTYEGYASLYFANMAFNKKK
ncbi:hypothetical protein [Oricola indica]|uniref:hypothetical protein n=1 Tax=Oricola indica TaxID=2872591 RepID=UPI001CBCE012|nr:hypothetical protein [Oricola indica]